ncbi:MAG: hypothetical protein M0P47_09210 [Bacteroidales bacterium]|nr:hypothetical protein [Bacteroidales bacterium]
MTISEIQALVTKPRSETAIRRGIVHSRRLRFHNDATLCYNDATATYLPDFIWWVEKLLPADKSERFKQLINYPLPTNELTESIWKNLARVFEGENRTIDIKLSDKSLLADFKTFFDNDDFQLKAFRALQGDVDSVVVCDMPQDTGKPYYYFIGTSSLIDISVDCDDNVEYVIYEDGEGHIVSMDKEWIRVFNGERRDVLKLIREVPNPIGRVPAHMLWRERLTNDNEVNRKSPITSVLGELDKLLFDMVSRDYAEMYGKYPILATYDIEKEYEGDPGDQKKKKEGIGKDFLGAGAVITSPPPTSKEDPDLNVNAVKFVNADPEILKFINTRIKEDWDRIFKSVVGDSGEVRNDAAKNEKQIESGFESKQDVITKIKYQFEEINEWVIETLCLMAYGEGFLNVEVDYGTQFYLTDEYALLNSLSLAKEKRVPDAIISDITRQYFETKYRADSETKKRMKIVLDLDPLPSKSIEDVFTIYSVNPGLIGDDNMFIKLHLDALLQRFERENVPLTQFGNQFEYYEKINIINQTIRGYAKPETANIGQQEQPVQNQ